MISKVNAKCTENTLIGKQKNQKLAGCAQYYWYLKRIYHTRHLSKQLKTQLQLNSTTNHIRKLKLQKKDSGRKRARVTLCNCVDRKK